MKMSHEQNEKYICMLSAADKGNLNTMVKKLLENVTDREFSDKNLPDICYTLQTGREALKYRLAFTCSSIEELKEKLKAYLDGNADGLGIETGNTEEKNMFADILEKSEMKEAIDKLLVHHKAEELMRLWLGGVEIEWEKFYEGHKCRILRLPTYSFSEETYCIPYRGKDSVQNGQAGIHAIHPFLHENTSDFYGQSFYSHFSTKEVLFGEDGLFKKLAQLEMVSTAVRVSFRNDFPCFELVDMSFQDVSFMEEEADTVLSLENEADCLSFTMADAKSRQVISSGKVLLKETIARYVQDEFVQECGKSYPLDDSNVFTSEHKDRIYMTFLPEPEAGYKVEEVIPLVKVTYLLNEAAKILGFSSLRIDGFSSAGFHLEADRVDAIGFTIIEKRKNGVIADITFFAEGTCVCMLNDVQLCDNCMSSLAAETKDQEVLTYEETWEEEERKGDDATGENVIVVFSKSKEKCDGKIDNCLLIDAGDGRTGADECLVEAGRKYGKVDGIFFLWNGRQENYEQNTNALLTVWKAIGQSGIYPKKILIGADVDNSVQQCYVESLIGLERSLKMVYQDVKASVVIRKESETWTTAKLIQLLCKEFRSPGQSVLYENGSRKVMKIRTLQLKESKEQVLKENGTYIITGGMGGIGKFLCSYLAQRFHGKIAVIGRRSLDAVRTEYEEQKQVCQKLEYYSADVCDVNQMEKVIKQIVQDFGKINGVFHAAGISGSGKITENSLKQYWRVVNPKIQGTENLEQALQDVSLDFVCYFSSSAAVLGDFGSCDYSVANRYLMSYGRERAKEKQDQKTFVISWPLWREGGMHFTEKASEQLYLKTSGQTELEAGEGMAVLEKLLLQDSVCCLVIKGKRSKVNKFLSITDAQAQGTASLEVVKNLVSEVSSLPLESIDVGADLINLGFNDVQLGELFEKLSEHYQKEISFTSYRQFTSIRQIAEQIALENEEDIEEVLAPVKYSGSESAVKKYRRSVKKREKVHMKPQSKNKAVKKQSRLSVKQDIRHSIKNIMKSLLSITDSQFADSRNLADYGFDSISLGEFATGLSTKFHCFVTPDIFFSYPTVEKITEYFYAKHVELSETVEEQDESETDANEEECEEYIEEPVRTPGKIAAPFLFSSRKPADEEKVSIIGMSGRFPSARTVDEFWKICEEGKDVVEELPEDRKAIWERLGYEGRDLLTVRAGIIPGVKEFDPMFFDISLLEAKKIDPRQRLLLEEIWTALEDAGYGNEALEKSKIGVFVGGEGNDYDFVTNDFRGLTTNNTSMLAARIAYLLNFSGPNMVINTACSSGLTAFHQACLSIRNGECDTAVVAAAGLLLSPNAYMTMEQSNMLSARGKCFAFDKNADGLVPSEAVVAIVLKKAELAVKDHNYVYADVIGSGINYDGKTNGITAPSGKAQVQLMKSVYDRFHIDPKDISLIVSHGTGTKLGDPIEINALSEVFSGCGCPKQSCALASVKSNVGHTLPASGLVSIVYLAKAMQSGEIPAQIHYENPNEYIDWNSSPFYINTSLKQWSDGPKKKRMGTVSAFGMGGTNVHVVMESAGAETQKREAGIQQSYFILPFSAKSEVSLKSKLMDMQAAFMKNKAFFEQKLDRVSYSLLNCRQHFKYRYAIVVRDIEEAILVLDKACQNMESDNIISGTVSPDRKTRLSMADYISILVGGLIGEAAEAKVDADDYDIALNLAELYCSGYEKEIALAYKRDGLEYIRIPVYPFENAEYWMESLAAERSTAAAGPAEKKGVEKDIGIRCFRYSIAEDD